jgi:hypothetical protein
MAPHAVKMPATPGVMTRRNLLFSMSTALGVGSASYARLVEPQWLETTYHHIKLTAKPLGQRIRVLHLSDLHASSYVPMSFLERAIEMGLAWWPDLICLTGDFITCNDSSGDLGYYRKILSRLSSAAPAFACLGNHDGGVWASSHCGCGSTSEVVHLLKDSGITLLQNERQLVRFGGQPLQLVGVGDLWSGYTMPAVAYRQYRDLPTILLAHNPDTKDAAGEYPWDLQLSGHTHGGQVRLLLDGGAFVPVRDKRYLAGLGKWRGRWIYITRGLGNIRGVRFCCRPEISLLELV